MLILNQIRFKGQMDRFSLNSSQVGLSVPEQLKLILTIGSSLKKWKKASLKSKDRFNRLRELVITEKDYYDDLVIIRDKIQRQLEAAKIITHQQSNSMFPNIDGMIDLSDQIYQEFSIILKKWERKTTMIGTAMLKFSPFLMIYSDFFKNLNENQTKIKAILSKSEKARNIEKGLSTQNKIVTINDLMSKPFQRPLKYHLILRDYWSKTEANHPDYLPLKSAIDCYHKVNEQNNLSVENQEKSQTMVNLQNKFGNIIESEARYYITQYDAVCLDIPIVMYLFSDLAILVYKKLADKELLRINFNKYSHVETAGDVSLFKNRLYFYGRSNCVHMSFTAKAQRDQVYHTINNLITDINQKETVRETTIIQRLSSRRTLQRRFSFTNLEPQLVRPINAEVLGMETRSYGEQNMRNFYVVEFYPAQANQKKTYTPRHISLLEEQTILKLQRLIELLYPNELRVLPISTVPKSLITEHEYSKSYNKKFQLKFIFIQLFLNSLLRSNQILKRIDYVLYVLGISDPIWNFLKINNQECDCPACCRQIDIKRYDDYFKEMSERSCQKLDIMMKSRKVEYCEMRTIVLQEQFSQLYPELLYKAHTEEKIAWVKSKLGRINHTLANTKPDSPHVSLVKMKVMMRGFPNNLEFEVKCSIHDRARSVITQIGHKRQFSLEDYALVADINGKAVILDDDEPLSNLERKLEVEGVFGALSSFFHKREDYPVKLYLQKYWVVFSGKDYINPAQKSRRVKLNFQVQSIMKRLYTQEMRVGDEDMLEFYALFLCKRYYFEFRQFTPEKVAQKIRNRSEIYFPARLHEESCINRLYKKIEKYKGDALIKTDFDFAIRIAQKAASRPGWSCIMQEVFLQTGNSRPKNVKVGCDLMGIKIREKGKITMIYEFKYEDDNWSCHTKGETLIITEGNHVYNLSGRQIWKLRKQVQFYQLFIKSFVLH